MNKIINMRSISMKILEGLKLIEGIEKQLKQIAIIDYIQKNEQWCKVAGFNNYIVSTLGRVINTATGDSPCVWRHPLGYAMVRLREGEKDVLYEVHRLIAFTFIENVNDCLCVDHINNNPWDNRVVNLRWCTQQQNSQNRTKTKSKTSSNFKGVVRSGNKWKAQIGHQGQIIYLGYFKTEFEAGRVYNEKARELFGEYANLNVP